MKISNNYVTAIPSSSKQWRLLVLGHIIENFDNTLYGFFAVMLSSIFFPSSSPSIQLLSSYGAFAAGFIARPAGAIVFGLIGDKIGRKKPLILSMMLVGFPTLFIGLLPAYEIMGIYSPILLILFRLAQGFFIGGEFTGANLYIAESSDKKSQGRKTGNLISSGTFGAILATIIGSLVTHYSMPSWGWRIPFVLGGLSAFLVYIFRRKLPETEDFEKSKVNSDEKFTPWKDILKQYKLSLAVGILLAGLTIMPLYYSTIFGNRIFKEFGFSTSSCMILNMASLSLCAIFIMIFGRLADKIGFYKQILFGTVLTALVTLPAFIIINVHTISILNIFSFLTLFALVSGIINGCAMPYISSLFPIHCRYSGVALSVTVGQALFGGTAPLVASYLTDVTGSKLSPSLWLIFISLATTCVVLIKNRYTRSQERIL